MEWKGFQRCSRTKLPAYSARRASGPRDDLIHALQHRTFLFVPRRSAGVVLHEPSPPPQVYSAGHQLFLLRKLELQIHSAVVDFDRNRLHGWYLAGEGPTGSAEENGPDPEPVREPRLSRLLQVLQFSGQQPGVGAGQARAFVLSEYRAAPGYQLPHVPKHVLRGGCISRRAAGRPQSHRLCAVHLLLPATGSRAHRSRAQFLSRFFPLAAAVGRGCLARGLADCAGPHQEDGVRRSVRQSGQRLFQKCVRKSRLADRLERSSGVRDADLLRFFRLYGHGHRHGEAAGLPFPRELPAAVPGREHHGLLAPLAHLAIHLAARLSVLLIGWQSAGTLDDLPQFDAHHAARRAVARRELELRNLGRLPWRAARPGACLSRRQAGPRGLELALSVEGDRHFRTGHDRLGFLSRRRSPAESTGSARDVSRTWTPVTRGLAFRVDTDCAGAGGVGGEARLVRACASRASAWYWPGRGLCCSPSPRTCVRAAHSWGPSPSRRPSRGWRDLPRRSREARESSRRRRASNGLCAVFA